MQFYKLFYGKDFVQLVEKMKLVCMFFFFILFLRNLILIEILFVELYFFEFYLNIVFQIDKCNLEFELYIVVNYINLYFNFNVCYCVMMYRGSLKSMKKLCDRKDKEKWCNSCLIKLGKVENYFSILINF